MLLEEISEKEFIEYEKTSKYRNFLQTPQIGHMRQNDKWETVFLGLKNNSKIVSACMLISHKEFLNKKEYYSPRGVLTDYDNYDLLKQFLYKIKNYVKRHNGFILRIDPYIEKAERDIDGNLVKNGYNNYKLINYLKTIGFKERTPEQAKWVFTLDIKNKTIEEIYKNMKQNTRNCINKTNKFGIKIKELNINNIEEFMNVVESTSKRKHISMKTVNYYKGIYEEYNNAHQMKMLGAYLDTEEYYNKVNDEYIDVKEKLQRTPNNESNVGKIRELNVSLESLNKRLAEAKQLLNKKQILLSASMFIIYNKEVIYFISGNYDEYLHFYAQYKVQYEMIKYAIENNYETYNFYGISGIFEKKDARYGVYEFKKGFNGKVVELIGEYYIYSNKLVGLLYTLTNSTKKIIKKLVNK